MLKCHHRIRGGNLYRRERKKKVKTEPKPAVEETEKNSIDDNEKSMVEDDNVPLPSDTIRLPKRRLPDLEFPNNLKYHTGYNCHLAHERVVRNNIIIMFFLCFIYSNFLIFFNFSWFSYLANPM